MTAVTAARAARLIVWDFDGVIKDSVEVKTKACVRLFEPFGAAVAEQVRAHHEANGGMSRFETLPIYLRLAGAEPTEARVHVLSVQFGQLVQQAVIDAPWVPGVESYLRRNPHRQVFALVSATPQDELERMVGALALRGCFAVVFGAPTSKTEAVRLALRRLQARAEESVMIGDARTDLETAWSNHVPFVLRRHAMNADVFSDYDGPSISDLTEVEAG